MVSVFGASRLQFFAKEKAALQLVFRRRTDSGLSGPFLVNRFVASGAGSDPHTHVVLLKMSSVQTAHAGDELKL